MDEYILKMKDDFGGFTEITIEAKSPEEAIAEIEDEAEYWVKNGEWSPNGCEVNVDCYLNYRNEQIYYESCEIVIKADEDYLIKEAGGDVNCEHEWVSTYEVEGGLKENPGVWSMGGTKMVFKSHCEHCGLHRTETKYGSQSMAGQMDELEFSL